MHENSRNKYAYQRQYRKNNASNSRILKHVLSDFHKYVRMARKASVTDPARAEKSIEEHKSILQAIKNRNADEAESLANAHMMNVMKNLNMKEQI